jgi:hypothetical protein
MHPATPPPPHDQQKNIQHKQRDGNVADRAKDMCPRSGEADFAMH